MDKAARTAWVLIRLCCLLGLGGIADGLRGRRFVGFTLDLSNYTGVRSERITQIEFWTPAGKQAARRASLIYTPGASDRPPAKPVGEAAEGAALSGVWEQTDIFDYMPTELPAAAQPDASAEG